MSGEADTSNVVAKAKDGAESMNKADASDNTNLADSANVSGGGGAPYIGNGYHLHGVAYPYPFRCIPATPYVQISPPSPATALNIQPSSAFSPFREVSPGSVAVLDADSQTDHQLKIESEAEQTEQQEPSACDIGTGSTNQSTSTGKAKTQAEENPQAHPPFPVSLLRMISDGRLASWNDEGDGFSLLKDSNTSETTSLLEIFFNGKYQRRIIAKKP